MSSIPIVHDVIRRRLEAGEFRGSYREFYPAGKDPATIDILRNMND
jgi:hypothetical protein